MADEVAAEEVVSAFSKVDKTGFIGFFADKIEIAIDLGHSVMQSAGIQYTYGFSIMVFTVLGKNYLLFVIRREYN